MRRRVIVAAAVRVDVVPVAALLAAVDLAVAARRAVVTAAIGHEEAAGQTIDLGRQARHL
jgi:hypothetical protein